MGAHESYLSSPDYGYDYVVAVTQDSVNVAAITFLSTRQPTVSVCYVYDDNGDPKRIDYSAFKQSAGGADPFNVPASGPDRDSALTNIDQAGFMFGFQAAMGLPQGFPAAQLPQIVTLGATASDPVVYRLLCRTFVLAEMKAVPHKPSVYQSFAQPAGPTGAPWVFTYNVNLLQQPVADLKTFMTTPAFAGLPETARQKVTQSPDAFSIQQLLFDFNKASRTASPEISGVDRVLKEKLDEDFSVEYFTQMQAAGPPVIAVLPRSGDPLANLSAQFSLNPNPAQPTLACINYLCTLPPHAPPVPKPFAWNWIDPPAADASDGVCVMNRSQLVEHLRGQLTEYVENNKWIPHPVEVEVYLTTYHADFGVFQRNRWHGDPPDNLQIATDSLDVPTAGNLLLHWQFHAKREYDYLGGSSWMLGETAFELKVTCSGNQLIVEQHALVYCKLVMVTFDRHEWNLIDLTLTDTFTLAAEHDGKITANRTSSTDDQSASIGGDFAVPDLKSRFEAVQAYAKARVVKTMIDIPLTLVNDIVFPGGRAFMFKEVTFSDHQDLVAHITYADPS